MNPCDLLLVRFFLRALIVLPFPKTAASLSPAASSEKQHNSPRF
jgi:hypothetical protein